MENKTLSRALFGVTFVLAIITFYFFIGMMTNGAPSDYDPEQMGLELLRDKKASNDNYMEKGTALYETQVKKINSNITAGVSYMRIILYLAGGLMVIFLLWGLIQTLTTDFKKGLPSLMFAGIALLAFIFAYMSAGNDVTGFEGLVKKEGMDTAKEMVSSSNFWVYGVLFVLIPGAIILVIDLIIGIVRGYTK